MGASKTIYVHDVATQGTARITIGSGLMIRNVAASTGGTVNSNFTAGTSTSVTSSFTVSSGTTITSSFTVAGSGTVNGNFSGGVANMEVVGDSTGVSSGVASGTSTGPYLPIEGLTDAGWVSQNVGAGKTVALPVNATPHVVYPAINPAPINGGGAMMSEPNTRAEWYRELAGALAELKNTSSDDEWHIDTDVYNTSIQVAAALLEQNIPTPRMFSHGPKSVVFNWDDGENNLYLTVGKCRVWAAASSASELKMRLELTAASNNIASEFFRGLNQSFTKRPLLTYGPETDAP